MITILDHRDSFTSNLEHLLAEFDKVQVIDRKSISFADIQASKMLVFSPGPGCPGDYPESQAIYQEMKGKIPMLGICLGFQLIMEQEGSKIIRQNQVLHGVESEIMVDEGSVTYRGVATPVKVGRYHSLQIDSNTLKDLSPEFKITSNDPIRNVPLSFENLKLKLFGLQYHPESFLSKGGNKIISNILHESMEQRWKAHRSS